MQPFLIGGVLAYLLGSIPFGYLLVRTFRGQDVRRSGSGNIGATNVARSSPALGVLTLLLDAAKGYLAVAVARNIYLGSGADNTEGVRWIMCWAAVAAVAGHMFPVWLGFRGGKGVATAVGAFLYLAPYAVLGALSVFLVAVVVTRYVSLGSVLGAVAFPLMVWWRYGSEFAPGMIALLGGVSVLVIWRHHENIARLLAGTESRFQLRRG
jgi:glycerol-3-phosphate acyltransferase PlsY